MDSCFAPRNVESTTLSPARSLRVGYDVSWSFPPCVRLQAEGTPQPLLKHFLSFKITLSFTELTFLADLLELRGYGHNRDDVRRKIALHVFADDTDCDKKVKEVMNREQKAPKPEKAPIQI